MISNGQKRMRKPRVDESSFSDSGDVLHGSSRHLEIMSAMLSESCLGVPARLPLDYLPVV
jgi:hypothetical protein